MMAGELTRDGTRLFVHQDIVIIVIDFHLIIIIIIIGVRKV